MAKKVDFYAEYDRLQNKVEGYSRQVERILDTFANESTALAVESGYEGKKYFRIDNYPETKKAFEQLQRQSANDIRHVIINGATALWADSNFLNDKFAQSVLGNKADLDEYKRYFNNNAEARDAFLRRQRNGMNLSQRIWRIQDEFKEGFEGAITVAIQEGTSAAQLSRSIRQYLREPDKLFRRIGMYNDKGELEKFRLSKPALQYNPGAGMYRSSYRNAMRVAATEINMAYRQADQLRWQQMDFIVGYEIKRSGHPYPCPVCEALVGRYPKDFVWTGFHPYCRCRSIPILKTEDEMDRDDALIMSGKEPLSGSVNSIGGVPDNYKKWIADNQDRIVRAKEHGTLPYFLKDNSYSQYFEPYKQLNLAEISSLLGSDRDTLSRFTGKDGMFTSERQALHDKIIGDVLRNGSTRTNTVYMLGGAPANGKSTLVDSGILPHPRGVLKIDPDAIKSMIPEYARMLSSGDELMIKRAAKFVHEESSALSKAIQSRLNAQNWDYVLDGVNDGSFEKLLGKLSEMRSGGRRIRADYVSLDTDLSIKLAIDRAKRTGRDVPMNFVTGMNREVSKLVPEIIEKKAIDDLFLWDTNINGKPRLILEMIDGKLKIHDQELYDAFLMKSKR